jgi:hypothetical protein
MTKLSWWFIFSRCLDLITTGLNYIKFGKDIAEVSPINSLFMSWGFIYFVVYQLAITGVLLFFFDRLPKNIGNSVLKIFTWISLLISASNLITYLIIK